MSDQKPNHLTRRDFLRQTSMLSGMLLLAACAPSAPSSGSEASGEAAPAAGAAAPEGVAVQFWTGWGELVPFFDELKDTDEFRELMGGNDVVMKPTVKTEALLTAIAAGTPPDIASEAPYLDLMAREVLLPIDDWVAGSSIIKQDDFIQGNWERGYYQNVQYGVPAWECFVRFGLDYNARMVEAAGLDPDNPPVTWDDALEWHKALTQFDDAGNLLQIGLDPYDAEGGGIGDGFLAARSWGFDWFNEETGEFNLDNPKMAEAFEVMGEFYRIAGPDNMAGMRSVEGQDTWGGSYNAEVQAMIIEGYWHPGETMAQKPEVGKYNRATWVPVPEDRRGAKIQGTGGHYVIFFKDAPNAQAGFPFADGCGPAQGRERSGPTAAVLSVTSWPHSPMIGGLAYNLKFNSSLFRTPAGFDGLETLLLTYLRRGGFEAQVNVVDAETLKQARTTPELYRDLVVRIGGYCDYFTRLSPEMQDELILRTEFEGF